ncbi:hypothetical protein WR25_18589 [Diploscapter pachys]|uniref:Protein kinase domain-containing protein n=1 Tax=Diploscapter pachys TaxID=2018661 RepID=A0A2A2LMK2_9BILA|nr:hypothetical protein WR25_18589 [Diploscapter pachys]
MDDKAADVNEEGSDVCLAQPSMIQPTSIDVGSAGSEEYLGLLSAAIAQTPLAAVTPSEANAAYRPLLSVPSKPWYPKIKKRFGAGPFKMGEMLKDRWMITGMIGKGGYGSIYHSIDMRALETVAIKVEPRMRSGKVTRRMLLEQKVLCRLQGRPHVPRMVASGHTIRHNYIVMALLSVNLGELKKMSPVNRLSRSTTARILQQAIAALRDMHTVGYLHRDVKWLPVFTDGYRGPANMCFGLTPRTRHVLMLVDFGLVRRYRQPTGELRAPRIRTGFRGTLRYASLRAHHRIEQGPSDDLIAIVYSGYELMVGELPWQLLSESTDLIMSKKRFQNTRDYLSIVSESYADFGMVIFHLTPRCIPNYTALQGLIQDLVAGKAMEDLYDWEENYCKLIN